MKIRMGLLYFTLMLGLSGCYVPESGYYPDYDEDYVYAVGYYGYRPYDWGQGFYTTYGWGTRDWVTQPRFDYVQSAYVVGPGCALRR